MSTRLPLTSQQEEQFKSVLKHSTDMRDTFNPRRPISLRWASPGVGYYVEGWEPRQRRANDASHECSYAIRSKTFLGKEADLENDVFYSSSCFKPSRLRILFNTSHFYVHRRRSSNKCSVSFLGLNCNGKEH